MSCVFCQIINKKIPANIIFQNKNIIVFKDIKPQAPVHLLIIPKEHISNLNKLENKDLLIEIFSVIKKIARKVGVLSGYKIQISVGKKGGQEINHLHFHLLGGWKK
ncbi:MAG: HIT domain-containing protein [Candidatus Pacebacteria bacterium]|nr:HIT domain-containing protein [Candidatus Paceibacterota bacterium]